MQVDGRDKRLKGIYALLLRAETDLTVNVGSLGRISLEHGNYYVYVGSAQNSLESRVARHLAKLKKLRWHIDYLTSRKEIHVQHVVYAHGSKEYECVISKSLSRSRFAEPVPKFGCGDCRLGCRAHLFLVRMEADQVRDLVDAAFREAGLGPKSHGKARRAEPQ